MKLGGLTAGAPEAESLASEDDVLGVQAFEDPFAAFEARVGAEQTEHANLEEVRVLAFLLCFTMRCRPAWLCRWSSLTAKGHHQTTLQELGVPRAILASPLVGFAGIDIENPVRLFCARLRKV